MEYPEVLHTQNRLMLQLYQTHAKQLQQDTCMGTTTKVIISIFCRLHRHNVEKPIENDFKLKYILFCSYWQSSNVHDCRNKFWQQSHILPSISSAPQTSSDSFQTPGSWQFHHTLALHRRLQGRLTPLFQLSPLGRSLTSRCKHTWWQWNDNEVTTEKWLLTWLGLFPWPWLQSWFNPPWSSYCTAPV